MTLLGHTLAYRVHYGRTGSGTHYQHWAYCHDFLHCSVMTALPWTIEWLATRLLAIFADISEKNCLLIQLRHLLVMWCYFCLSSCYWRLFLAFTDKNEWCVVCGFAVSNCSVTSKIPTELGFDRFTATSTVVRWCQSRHLYPLGRILRSELCVWMVLVWLESTT